VSELSVEASSSLTTVGEGQLIVEGLHRYFDLTDILIAT
jgi:hypothetical protein